MFISKKSSITVHNALPLLPSMKCKNCVYTLELFIMSPYLLSSYLCIPTFVLNIDRSVLPPVDRYFIARKTLAAILAYMITTAGNCTLAVMFLYAVRALHFTHSAYQ